MHDGRGDTGIANDGTNTRYVRAKTLIAEKGIAPTIRAVMASVGVSQSTAERFFAQMQQEGVIKRAGRRYELAA